MRFKTDGVAVAYVVCALFVVFLLIFGWKVHFIETPGAETNGYANKAQELLSGHIPRDPWHPHLYPILSAANADFVIVGRIFLQNRPVELLNAVDVPDFIGIPMWSFIVW